MIFSHCGEVGRIVVPDPKLDNCVPTLLLDLGKKLGSLKSFSREDRRRIREVLELIVGGQELDFARFGHATDGYRISKALAFS